MLLRFTDGTPFALGATPYVYRAATAAETSPRIIITIVIGEIRNVRIGRYRRSVPALFARIPAARAQLDSALAIPAAPLRWSRGLVKGVLQRMPVTLPAVEGESLTIEATAFIPQADDDWNEDLPCILGMQGCLEYLRFAVDPNDDTFYFGALGDF